MGMTSVARRHTTALNAVVAYLPLRAARCIRHMLFQISAAMPLYLRNSLL